MGICQSCCDQDVNSRYVKQTGTELATVPQTTAPKQQTAVVTGTKAKERRENGWRATGIIGLRDQQIKELPQSALQVATATVLDASNNRLKALPDNLSDLAALQRLVLVNNLLVSLPASLCRITTLKLLNLDTNRLTELPEELGGLAALEKLSVNGNQLTRLPATLGRLPALKLLSASSNQLAALPAELPPALEELDVSFNAIAAIPPSLGSLQKLKILNLDTNKVCDVPAEVLEGCAALHTLSLHANPITPDTLQDNPAFQAFEARRQQKYNKVIAGGVLLGAKGMDEGVDRKATRSP
uniref:Uncharacterized protein n=1 Tax=Chlamydomonas leiostraca TaxID=1034604 RepID=A0A7S0R2H1_9CHLO|mmetsp:Transcript_12239/g.29835  ORF Transcript_12239/g.29835 Transcript_12239/m.29835 type:complete len:299 (+) Transcript_12239:90-986(+)